MGTCISTVIAINLDGNNAFYLTGETVSGTVGLNTIQEKVEADEIYIKLTGEIGYTTQHTTSNGRGQTTTHTQYHHVPFYFSKLTFAQPAIGQSELVCIQGQYSWPFQFRLIDCLPPTLNQTRNYPHVRYYLQVVIDKPWYKPNTRETRYLTIYPRVNLLQNPECLIRTMFGNQNRKDITLKGILNKLGYVPGELINGTLEIENPRRVLILHIIVSMLQSYKIGPSPREYTIFEATLPTIMNLKDEQIRETFSIPIPPVRLPPSYQFHGGIERPVAVNVCYKLKFEVKVEGIFTNFDINIPVILGTEPIPYSSQQQTSNPLMVPYSSNPQSSMLKDDDPPPDYESVVRNTKSFNERE